MNFKPTKEQQNEALAGVFELYYNPLNTNRLDHYIYSFCNSLMLYPKDVSRAMALTKKLNDRLIYPLNKEEQAQAYWRLEKEWFDDLLD
ncbi:hypothetical protein ACFQGR_04585 [Weissella sagaensis]|uniref:Uncharacterized protein n=1 Tax=Weissella sagaensis TaxID=2559928 RepID=A0ABW1RTC3_9LACO|nr:hypothetical protein [Weissella sagaensis]